jgi:hypothetical protein
MDTSKFDNFILNINDNKQLLFIIILLLGLYTTYYLDSDDYSNSLVRLFDNNLFKLVVFIIIAWIAVSSPALGVCLGIAFVVTIQVIVNLRIKQELDYEKFTTESYDYQDVNNDNYLVNPLSSNNDLSPITNLNLNLTNPNDIYNKMIDQGKSLLDDSLELEKDYENYNDIRELRLSEITKRNGLELVKSGLNRLQKADDGQINLNKNNIRYVKFNKFLEENKDDTVIMTLYHKLQSNYNLLLNTNNKDKFDQLLENIYITEFELLVHVYRNKRSKMSNDKKKQIETLINQIKQNKNEEKLWLDKLNKLFNLLC